MKSFLFLIVETNKPPSALHEKGENYQIMNYVVTALILSAMVMKLV